MTTATTIAQIVLRVAGLANIVLGLLFWSGHAFNLVPLHMLLGIVLVLSLWTLAGLAAGARVSAGLVVFAIVWGFVVPALGFTQDSLVTGDAHWVIRVLHLLVGLAAMGLGETLARRIR
jgi:hypothetical protein